MGSETHAANSSGRVISFPPFLLNATEQQLRRGDLVVPIKPKALALLRFLLENPGRLVTKEALVSRFWGDVHISEGVLKTHIGEIRQALGDCAREPRFIETVHRRGYRFIGRLEGSESSVRLKPAYLSIPNTTPRCPPHHVPHVVGRAAELELLMTSWARAREGERQVVFVTGEAGIGKTVLVNTFLRELLVTETNILITWGECVDQYGSGEPYLPIMEALHRPCAEPGGERILECLLRHAPAWSAQAPKVDAATSTSTAEPARLAATRKPMLAQMARALEALTEQSAVVLLVEDLHWADYSTLDLLAYLAQRANPARLLVLGTYRPAEAASGRLANMEQALKTRHRCVTLLVPHLSEAAIGEYLARRFTGHKLPTAVSAQLHQRTEGNALFMVGVVDDWLHRGLLAAADGACKLTASLEELVRSVPDSFVRMIERELSRLSPFEQCVLEAASLAGNEFSTAAVASALGTDTVEVEAICVAWARRGQFLKSRRRSEWKDGTIAECCAFSHGLYQQVIYDRIGAARRIQLHRRMGERLEAGCGDQPESMASELALHFQRGHDYERAVRYLRAAGEHALRQSAYNEAIDHLMRALELVEKLPEAAEKIRIEVALRVLVAPPLRAIKGDASLEVEQMYDRAAALSGVGCPTSERFLIMAGMGAIRVLRGASRAALELSERFLSLAENEADESAISEASLLVGISCHHLGQHVAARIHLERAIASIPKKQPARATVGGHNPAIAGRCFLAFSSCMLGHLDRARREAEKTLALARELAEPFAVAFATNFCSHVHHLRREYEAAEQQADALAALCTEKRFGMFSPMAMLLKGGAQIEGQDVASGIQLLQSGWAALKATGARVYSKYWACLLADGYVKMRQTHAALQVIEAAMEDECAGGERIWDAELLRIKGDVLLRSHGVVENTSKASGGGGRNEQIERCLLGALRIAKEQDAKLFELRAAMSLSRYWAAGGKAAQGRALLLGIYRWFTEGLDTKDLIEARLLLEQLSRAAPERLALDRA